MPETTYINWFNTKETRWARDEYVHDWEGIDSRFPMSHWWIAETLDPDGNRLYELLLCDDESIKGFQAGLYTSVESAKNAAERINALFVELRSAP